jgi:predicted enzyme related to lactoylglutathione lyase
MLSTASSRFRPSTPRSPRRVRSWWSGGLRTDPISAKRTAYRAVRDHADDRAGAGWPARTVIVRGVNGPLGMIEFPADDPDRARRFWSGLLGVELAERSQAEGRGWQTESGAPVLGIHKRGGGPGDTASLPYFDVPDMDAALEQVAELGGSVIHHGVRWAICRDSEGSPFGLALAPRSPRAASPTRARSRKSS